MPDPAAATVLIVDDDAGLVRWIQRALQREQFLTATAGSGGEAIEWLSKNRADLMLLDLKLQDLEGQELINRLADINRPTPFIVITGQGDERVAVDMMKRGALDYLVKDANFVELVPTVVRRALSQIDREARVAEAEKLLRESELRLRNTLDNMMEGCQTIGFDWRYLYVNEAAARHGRRAASELLGRRILDVYPGIEKTRLFAALQECMNHRRSIHLENEFGFPDGGSSWFQLSIQSVPEGLFILSLDITERKKLEQEILDISELERRRLGQDLHDGLGQRLTALEMLSHGLSEDLKGHARDLSLQARRLNSELRETITQARLLSHNLAPVPLEGDGLARALAELAASTDRLPGVDCRFECDGPVSIDDVTTATHLYRIAQEAVNNALKHGKARRILIQLRKSGDVLELAVENNGVAMRDSHSDHRGVGLNVMQYRAGMIGAALTVESGKRKGVRIACVLGRKL